MQVNATATVEDIKRLLRTIRRQAASMRQNAERLRVATESLIGLASNVPGAVSIAKD